MSPSVNGGRWCDYSHFGNIHSCDVGLVQTTCRNASNVYGNGGRWAIPFINYCIVGHNFRRPTDGIVKGNTTAVTLIFSSCVADKIPIGHRDMLPKCGAYKSEARIALTSEWTESQLRLHNLSIRRPTVAPDFHYIDG